MMRGWAALLLAILLVFSLSLVGCADARESDIRNFQAHRDEYDAAAASVVAELRSSAPVNDESLSLPARFEALSSDGEVWINRKPGDAYVVTFWRQRGLLGQARAYVYVTDARQLKDWLDGSDESVELSSNWGWTLAY